MGEGVYSQLKITTVIAILISFIITKKCRSVHDAKFYQSNYFMACEVSLCHGRPPRVTWEGANKVINTLDYNIYKKMLIKMYQNFATYRNKLYAGLSA